MLHNTHYILQLIAPAGATKLAHALMTTWSSMLRLHVVMVTVHIVHKLTEPGLHICWHCSSPDALWQPCTDVWLTKLWQEVLKLKLS